MFRNLLTIAVISLLSELGDDFPSEEDSLGWWTRFASRYLKLLLIPVAVSGNCRHKGESISLLTINYMERALKCASEAQVEIALPGAKS